MSVIYNLCVAPVIVAKAQESRRNEGETPICGGSSKVKEAQRKQLDLSDTLSGIAKQRESVQFPFIQSRIQGGLPFLPQLLDFQGGTQARAFAPARAGLTRRLDRFGSDLPSGFREQSLSDFDARRARAFDDSIIQALMLDEETRARAAGLAQPLGYFSGAQQGFGNILGQQQPGSPLGSILGGAAAGLIGLL